MSQCATTNCEDESHKDDFAYCGKGHCSSCGGGCGDDDCSKCNRQAKWVSKKASNDRAFRTGWSVIKAPMYRGDECVHCGETCGGKSGNVAYECPDTGNAFCKGCYKHRKNYR